MTIKETLKSVLLQTGALRLRSLLLPRSIAVLAYHSVSTDRDGQSNYLNYGITTDAERFDAQMQILRNEYNPVTLDEIADMLHPPVSGKSNLQNVCKRRSVAVTFDDGFEDNYTVAAPIMEKYGIRGAIYLTVDAVQRQELPWFCRLHFLFSCLGLTQTLIEDPISGERWCPANPAEKRKAFFRCQDNCAKLTAESMRSYLAELACRFDVSFDTGKSPKMMTFEQAGELRQRGHIIGNHTFSHGNAAHIPPETLYQEIAEANEILERELDGKTEHFSYPHPCLNPQWNEQTLALTKQIGFKTAVLTDTGVVTQMSNPLLLQRVMLGNPNAAAFRWKLENAFAGRKV